MGARLGVRLAGLAALLGLATCALLPADLRPVEAWSLDAAVPIEGPALADTPCATYKLERYVNRYDGGQMSVFTSYDTYADGILENHARQGARHDYAPLVKALAPAVSRFLLPAGAECPYTAGLQFDNFIPHGAARYRLILRLKETASGVEVLRITRERTFDAEPAEGTAVALILADAATEVHARRGELAALITAPAEAPVAPRILRLIVLELSAPAALTDAAARRPMLTSLLANALRRTGRYEIVSNAVRDELLTLPAGVRALPGLDAVVTAALEPRAGSCVFHLTVQPTDHAEGAQTIEKSMGCGVAEVVDGIRAAVSELDAAPSAH